jgi:hypothetical protein
VLALAACVPGPTRAGARHPEPLDDGARDRVRHLEVPTAPLERDALASIPGARSDRIELAVALPTDLDVTQPHPILITQVTADARSNVAALSAYVPAAL